MFAFRMFKQRLKLLALAATLLLVRGVQSQPAEMRGLWVDAWGAGFLSDSQATQLINDCRTYNFNAIFVQMRRRGDAFYRPQSPNLEPRTTAISSSYDALADLINKAHSATPRIEVHCWVTANLVWSSENNPPQSTHVVNRHPEYLMKNFAGDQFLAEGKYLDPGHPDAMLWNYRMAMDIVSRYDIDGFHWDYIRYPQQDSGYNEVALQRFRAEYGMVSDFKPASNHARFSEWRRRQVTDFLRWVNADLLEVKPNLVISAAVFGSRSDAFNARFQDWAKWNNEGYIDLCLPMIYSNNNGSVYNPRVDDAWANQGVRRVYVGQGAYLNSKENTVTQLKYARSKGMGTIYYSYRTPNSGENTTTTKAQTYSHIKSQFQPTWKPAPVLPWKSSPTKGIAKGTITPWGSSEPIYNATVTLRQGPDRTQKTEAHGTFGFYEVPTGIYTITATAPGMGIATNTVTVVAGRVTDIDLTIPPTPPPNEGPLIITGIDYASNGVQLLVQANRNVPYELIASNDLNSWTVVATKLSPTDAFTMEHAAAAGEFRFYRVRRAGAP